jgi:hypothetical protein
MCLRRMSALDGASNRSYGACEREEHISDREDDQLLFGDHRDNPNRIVFANEEDNAPGDDVQEGVVKLEAMSQAWTRRSLAIAYLGFVSAPLTFPCF